MDEDFFRSEPTARSAWRMAVLMGANARTYKFALGAALLDFGAEGRTEVSLVELASRYALGIVDHLDAAPQAPAESVSRPTDFLSVAAREAARTRELGAPTEELLDAAVRGMPGMVMRKFHNLRGGVELPHRFYELVGGRRDGVVRLLPALHRATAAGGLGQLRGELEARWNIVEFSFSAEIGRGLVADGFGLDTSGLWLTDRRRRRSVAGVIPAVLGFQRGRCLLCWEHLDPHGDVAVDHVFPFSLMSRFTPWRGPDLDSVWNLSPAHSACNSAKSDRLPTPTELRRLAERNTAIMGSPHPLRRTLELSLGRRSGGDWFGFLRGVQEYLEG
ncbi:hypothetical protein LO762_15125 [Actinocorallia sp. API 0066]|uniref:HNH endonuclease n=1 Tax=Actinocorallia sp. API 0066 TaxID=2896846 RepID=UPI001E39648E|nr:HNH endonuclease domain-containing protein [Actinocorallia sp. API 0066]MCD0450511.1 hypothetical protein [Actinocorallia sp. API 0066]